MRNSIYLLIIIILQTTSCKRQHLDISTKSKSSIICANDSNLYYNLHNSLIYKDSTEAVFLKIKNDISAFDSTNLNECQKLPYTFIQELLFRDSLVLFKSVVDIKSFNKIDATNFYKDKNHIYVYQDNPATYPQFKIIDIKPEEAIIVKRDYIKDCRNVYFLGIKVSENAVDFKYIPNDHDILLFGDNKKIIWNWSEISKEDFLNVSLPKNVKDSLQSIYFPNK